MEFRSPADDQNGLRRIDRPPLPPDPARAPLRRLGRRRVFAKLEASPRIAARERKERKKSRLKSVRRNRRRRLCVMAHDILLDLEFEASEIDQKSIFDFGGFEIAQDLR